MTAFLCAAARVLFLAPPRLLIRTLDDLKRSNGVAPLGSFLRGVVYACTWLFELTLAASLL